MLYMVLNQWLNTRGTMDRPYPIEQSSESYFMTISIRIPFSSISMMLRAFLYPIASTDLLKYIDGIYNL